MSTPRSSHRRRRHSSPEETIPKFRLSSLNDSDSGGSDNEDDLDFVEPSHYLTRGRTLARTSSSAFFQPLSSRISPKENSSQYSELLNRKSFSFQHLMEMSNSFQNSQNSSGDPSTKTDTESLARQETRYPREASAIRQKDDNMAMTFVKLAKSTFSENSDQYSNFQQLLLNDGGRSQEAASSAKKLFKDYPLLLNIYLELSPDDLILVQNILQGVAVQVQGHSQSLRGQTPNTSEYELPVKELADTFVTIFRNIAKYKSLLEFRGDKAQCILNVLQTLLDCNQDPLFPRGDFVHALLRLSNKSGLYPQCFTLKGIQQTGLAVAAGHFGEVWKGDFHGSSVCLKIVKAYQNSHIEKLLKAYAKEAILWSQLSHPNLLPFYGIYHLGDEHGRICLVSPWMENGNVVEYIQRFPYTSRPLLLRDIAHGISYLHEKNIVHGDLKGANILVTSTGRACLSDFGLSSMSDPEVIKWTSMQSTVSTGGTVRWQAPELVDPDIEDVRTTKESDVYAFACVCYELFTGKVPFYEISRDAAVTLRISRGEKPSQPDLKSRYPDSVFYRGLTEEIWSIMQDCWRREPAERPNINEALNRLLIDSSDPRPVQNWEELSSARFRRAVQNNSNSNSDNAQVIELLREL
ncbi:kinase-like domain-containing protein [Cyathus striatus]|nr:kinase-like domain-containing protein [Cyathus striatus]